MRLTQKGTLVVLELRLTREQISTINSPADSSPAKTLTVLKTTSLKTRGNVEVCSSEPVAILTPAEVECLLLNTSEEKEWAVNAYIEDKLDILSRSGIRQMADMSDGAMLRILGEQEASLVVSPQRRWRKQSIRLVDVSVAGPSEVGIPWTSTPVKSVVPLYSQRKSCLLDWPVEVDLITRKKRVEFENGDKDTPPAKRSLAVDVSRGKIVVFLKLEVYFCQTLNPWRVCSLSRPIIPQLDQHKECSSRNASRVPLIKWSWDGDTVK